MTRAAAALKRRNRARLEAWIVREGAETRQQIASGRPSSPRTETSESQAGAVLVQVSSPGRDAEPEAASEVQEEKGEAARFLSAGSRSTSRSASRSAPRTASRESSRSVARTAPRVALRTVSRSSARSRAE